MAKEEVELEREYLSVINLLCCTGEGEGWVLSGGGGKGKGVEGKGGKRRLVTVEELREGYQALLDRKSIIEGGRWAFGEGDEETEIEVEAEADGEGNGEEMDLL